MYSRPAKRVRSSSETVAVDLSTIPELVESLDPASIADLLVTAAQTHPDIASLVKRISAAERAEVRNFDHLSGSAWRSLNVHVKDSQAYGMARGAADSVQGCLNTIQKGCRKTTSFRTKESALETLRKIGKSICLSNGVIGREIRNDYELAGELVITMLVIAESLTQEEKERMRPWYIKLVELQEIGHEYSLFEDLDEVRSLWEEEEEEEEEEDEEDDDEESEGLGYPDRSEKIGGSSGDGKDLEDKVQPPLLSQKHFEIL